MTPSARKALLYSFICALLFGSAFPAIKTVFQDWESRGIEITIFCIWIFAGVRFMLAGIGLLCAARKPLAELKNTSWKLLLLFTLGQTTLQYMLFYLGVYTSSGSLAALLAGSGSFWWMIIFGKIKPTMGSKAASGYALLAGGFILFLIGSPALFELPNLMSEKVIYLTFWLSSVSALGFAIWNHLSTIYPVSLLASYRFLIPLCGVVESLIILRSESPGIGLLIGGPLILASIFFAQKLQNSKP